MLDVWLTLVVTLSLGVAVMLRVCERVGDPELLTVWLSLDVPVVDALRVADVDPVSVGEGEPDTLGVAVWLTLCDCVRVAVPEPEPLCVCVSLVVRLGVRVWLNVFDCESDCDCVRVCV